MREIINDLTFFFGICEISGSKVNHPVRKVFIFFALIKPFYLDIELGFNFVNHILNYRVTWIHIKLVKRFPDAKLDTNISFAAKPDAEGPKGAIDLTFLSGTFAVGKAIYIYNEYHV